MKIPNIPLKEIRAALRSCPWGIDHHNSTMETRMADFLSGAIFVVELRRNVSQKFAKAHGIERHAGFNVSWYVGDPGERRKLRHCTSIKEVAKIVQDACRWYESVAENPPHDVGLIIDSIQSQDPT